MPAASADDDHEAAWNAIHASSRSAGTSVPASTTGTRAAGASTGALSQALGESTSQIASALKSGQSLVDLANSKGVSEDDLVKAIASAVQKDNPNLTSDLATSFATAMPTSGAFVNVAA